MQNTSCMHVEMKNSARKRRRPLMPRFSLQPTRHDDDAVALARLRWNKLACGVNVCDFRVRPRNRDPMRLFAESRRPEVPNAKYCPGGAQRAVIRTQMPCLGECGEIRVASVKPLPDLAVRSLLSHADLHAGKSEDRWTEPGVGCRSEIFERRAYRFFLFAQYFIFYFYFSCIYL